MQSLTGLWAAYPIKCQITLQINFTDYSMNMQMNWRKFFYSFMNFFSLHLSSYFHSQKYKPGKSKDSSIVEANYESLSIPAAFNSWKNTVNADLTHCSKIKWFLNESEGSMLFSKPLYWTSFIIINIWLIMII